MSDEYAAFRAQPGDNFKAMLRGLADEYLETEAKIAQIEAELEMTNAMLRDLSEKRIPEVTEGMDGNFDLGDGRELQLKEKVRASIAGDKRIPAINWLDEHDYGHIVKRQIVVEFGKDETERTEAFLKALQALEPELGTLVIKKNYQVHNATLVSWVTEQLSEGVDLPTETFGIYRQRTAKVKDK